MNPSMKIKKTELEIALFGDFEEELAKPIGTDAEFDWNTALLQIDQCNTAPPPIQTIPDSGWTIAGLARTATAISENRLTHNYNNIIESCQHKKSKSNENRNMVTTKISKIVNAIADLEEMDTKLLIKLWCDCLKRHGLEMSVVNVNDVPEGYQTKRARIASLITSLKEKLAKLQTLDQDMNNLATTFETAVTNVFEKFDTVLKRVKSFKLLLKNAVDRDSFDELQLNQDADIGLKTEEELYKAITDFSLVDFHEFEKSFYEQWKNITTQEIRS
ncbi:hypothetical protein HDU76_002996, partial [Blyttiomyces sp. JEL0837]